MFRWGTRASTSVIALYHPGGYGGIGVTDVMTYPGATVGLIADYKGDNRGPHSPEEVLHHLQTLKTNFPNAQIVTGTYDDFIKEIIPDANKLPLITKEIGDTWIHGSTKSLKKKLNLKISMTIEFIVWTNRISY